MILRLDYQTRAKPFPWAGAVLLALALAGMGVAAAYYHYTVAQTAYWEAKTGQIEGASNRASALSERDLKEMALEIRHANEVLGEITLPWDALFQALEWSSGRDVALLAIEPDAEKHQVKISGEAKNLAALWGYMGHLAAQEAFSSVMLRSHHVQRRERENPVRFALIVSWKVPE